MIMMAHGSSWPSPQLTGQADFWHPITGQALWSADLFRERREEIHGAR
jgi:hypothetical protein